MKKLSEYKNEDALDLLADIIEPATYIFADSQFIVELQKNKLSAVKYVIKNHKQSVLSILASLEGVPLDEYECNIFTLPVLLIDILNDKELMDFFNSQGLKIEDESSGSVMGNIEEEH